MKKKDQLKMIADQKNRNEKLVKEYLLASTEHKKPVTRRDFLRVGVITTIGYAMAPSMLSILGKMNVAQAAECVAGSTGLVPFITLNLSGGWGLTGNWVPFDEGNQPLTDYSKMSQGRTQNMRTALGNNARFFDNRGNVGGKFIEGLLATAGAAANKTSFVGIPSATNNDTGDNAYDMSGLLLKAGAAGSQLPNIGTRNSKTGVRHEPAFGINPTQPLIAGKFPDLQGALSFAGNLNELNNQQQIKLVEAISALSDSQSRSLASLSGGQNINDLMKCALDKNIENMVKGAANAIDPRQNTAVNNAWGGLSANNNDRNLLHASLAYNCIEGNSGPVSIDVGGYDYHDQGRATQDRKDLEAGELVGRLLATAQALNKKVFIALISDGSVSSPGNTAGEQWTGDSSSNAAAGFLAFDPAGAPSTSDQQIGWFNSKTRSVDRDFISSGTASMTAATIFCNWAKFSGDLSKAVNALPRNTFTNQQLDQIIKIA